MNRLRVVSKDDKLSEEDINLLRQRIISPNENSYPKNALHLFATNKDVMQHNHHILSQYPIEEHIEIEAVDIAVHPKTKRKYRAKSLDKSLDASLSAKLVFCKEARVMLTCNIDIEDGLTNGALGTVKDVVYTDNDSKLRLFLLILIIKKLD